MKKLFLHVLVFLQLLAACTKDKSTREATNTAPPIPVNYAPLTAGSYWIYDWYVLDSLGNSTFCNKTDSIYITGDTLIGPYIYAIREGTWFGSSFMRSFLRDSSGYLVDHTERIYFSATNHTDTLYTWTGARQYGFTKMTDIGAMVTVPAGTFETLNAPFTVINTAGSWTCTGTQDIHHNRYANNIGKVLSTFRYVSDPGCNIYEQRLVSYHVN